MSKRAFELEHAHFGELRRACRACVPPLADAHDVLAAARAMGWLVGIVSDIRENLREFAAAGVQRVMFGQYDLADLSALELLVELQ
mgnify:CR=1 FL=1